MALPSGYTQLKYIESSGAQFIKTAFFPSGNALRVEMKFRYTTEHSGLSLFGNHTYLPYSLSVYGARPTFWVGDSGDISCGPQTEQGVDYMLDATAANGTLTAIWNGTKYTAAYSGSLYTEQQMFIFGSSNASGTLAESGSGYRLYSFKIWDNGSLKRDYVPVKNSAGAIGLYDLQLGAFYANAGTGAFVAGPMAEPPSEYTKLEYIQSSGTQYIDTGFIPDHNTRVVLDGYNDSASSGWTYGVWTSSTSNQFAGSCNATYAVRYGSANARLSANVPVGKVHFDQNKNAYTVNETSGTLLEQSFSCAYSMYLFAINAAGTVSSGKFTGKVYSCQIYDNGTLVRDFVPAKNSSGTVGLYDTVNGVFYTNAGSGAFAEGPLASSPVEGTGVSLIGGASFGIKGGKCLIGGTAYAITEGKTLVGGTGHDISFGSAGIPVEITGTGSSDYCYAVINGVTYTDATSGVEAFAGDEIYFYVAGTQGNSSLVHIMINGAKKAAASASVKYASYNWTVPEECTSIEITFTIATVSARTYGRLSVTTT